MTTGKLHMEYCPECNNDWNCYCDDGPHTRMLCELCAAIDETSESERVKAQEWGAASEGEPNG